MTDITPANVAASATQPAAISLHDLTVIGVFIASNSAAVLLRSARGRIARVSAGDQAFGVVVAAISEDQVILTDRSGKQYALIVPGS